MENLLQIKPLKIFLNSNKNINTLDNDDKENNLMIDEDIIKFYEDIYKNPQEQINKLLNYNFPFISIDIDTLKDIDTIDTSDKIIQYTLRPIITIEDEKKNINDRLNNEKDKLTNLKLTMEKITNLLKNNDEEIIKILNEKIKNCPKDEEEKRLKDPTRTRKLIELITKNKCYIYILWIKYYYKLYISLLYDYNNLLNKFIDINKINDINLDYYELINKYKNLELQYKEIINYFNDLKDKFINLQNAYKYMYNKNILKFNSLKTNHIILINKFKILYEKNINFEKQINLLSSQNKKLLDELTIYKKEKELLNSKLLDYKNLILSSTNLEDLKHRISLL